MRLILALTSVLYFTVGSSAQANDFSYFFHFDAPFNDASKDYRKSTHALLTPTKISQGEAGDNDIAVYMYWHMFCPASASTTACPRKPGFTNVRNDIDDSIRAGLNLIESSFVKSNVKMWQIIDEPYLRSVPKKDIEHATSRLYWISQSNPYNYSANMPRWVNFAHDCFKDSNYSSQCNKPSLNTSDYSGVPGNATILSFDWYAATTASDCGYSKSDCHIDDHMNDTVIPTLNALKSEKWDYQKVFLVPGMYTGQTKKITAIGSGEALARYYDLSNNDDEVVGLAPFVYENPDNAAWEGVEDMDDGIQAEMMFQAIANSEIPTLKDDSFTPIFEYNDDVEFSQNRLILSSADSHYYSAGYETASSGEYSIRRLAFYQKNSYAKSDIENYTKIIFRCKIPRPNSRYVVTFTTDIQCNGNANAKVENYGYVSPISFNDANHAIINCRSTSAPYWDQGWTLLPPEIDAHIECKRVFGSQYNYFKTIGYSKVM